MNLKKERPCCISVLIDGEEYGILHTPFDRAEYIGFRAVDIYKDKWELLIKHPATKISAEYCAAIEQKLNELNKGADDAA